MIRADLEELLGRPDLPDRQVAVISLDEESRQSRSCLLRTAAAPLGEIVRKTDAEPSIALRNLRFRDRHIQFAASEAEPLQDLSLEIGHDPDP